MERLSSEDVPQANDPARICALAQALVSGGTGDELFEHPRDRSFYLAALRSLGGLDQDVPTDRLARLAVAAPDQPDAFAGVLAASRLGLGWLAFTGAPSVTALDPATARDFLLECTELSESTADRRASTLRRWLAFCAQQAADAPTPEPPPPPPPPRAPTPAAPRVDAHRFVSGLATKGVSLTLDTTDLCFVAALYLRADRASLASFEDDELVDVFEQICDLVTPSAENPKKRATHAIQRLRENRMLNQVGGGGLARPGEYTLSRLAAVVVEYFLSDEALTRESLLLLTRTLQSKLAEIRSDARLADDADGWRRLVIGPLSIVVAELVGSIERRQRGLDAQQEEIQRQIAELIDQDWFASIDHCQDLLQTTTDTLRELNEILLRDTHAFVAVLQDIQLVALDKGQPEGEEAAQRVIEHVDRIAEWGASRQRSWSEYYQSVHRFLQDVVRLDPDRALSERLRDQIAGWTERPFALQVADAPSIRLFRSVSAQVDRPSVSRPREDREAVLPLVAIDDARERLEAEVKAALQVEETLAAVTERILHDLPAERHFVTAGRVVAWVAEHARVRSPRERNWVEVGAIRLEDWDILEER